MNLQQMESLCVLGCPSLGNILMFGLDIMSMFVSGKDKFGLLPLLVPLVFGGCTMGKNICNLDSAAIYCRL